MIKILPILISLFLFSCIKESSSNLNYALDQAKENRNELMKVLNYYKQEPSDSLKYKAACFLIENMPYHYFYENVYIDKYKNQVIKIADIAREESDYLKRQHYLEESMGELNRGQAAFYTNPVKDIEVITADFLIENIEHSFMVWEKQPWGKYITFDEFCNEILPYRIANEPIENWKKPFFDAFQPVLDSLLTDDNPITACQLIYDSISNMRWPFIRNIQIPHLGGVSLLSHPLGNCREYSDYATYVMRALGLCGGIDYIIQHPKSPVQAHYWNYVRGCDSKVREFELYELRPEGKRSYYREKGKVYRRTYKIQEESLLFKSKLADKPYSNFLSPHMLDVSCFYLKNNELRFEINKKEKQQDFLYLFVFNNYEWIPFAWQKIEKDLAVFENVESDLVYWVGYWINNQILPIAEPFILNPSDSITYFAPDTVNRMKLELTRKYNCDSWLYKNMKKYAIGGKLQVSNDPDFLNPKTVYTIEEELEPIYHNIKLNLSDKYRYVRFLSADYGRCNMAEMEVFGLDGTELQGVPIGTNGSASGNKSLEKHAVFDKDPLTFFESEELSDSWCGLDLGNCFNISDIRFLFRNDDNNIREGDRYELFYFSKDGLKKSLGTKIGNREQVLVFENCPSNALYLLHNHTRGKEERIFSYENGKQIFW